MRILSTKPSSDIYSQNRERPKVMVQPAPIAPAPGVSSLGQQVLQRKAECACGGGCPRCQQQSTKSPISQPNDASEIEADLIADKMMRMEEEEEIQRKEETASQV